MHEDFTHRSKVAWSHFRKMNIGAYHSSAPLERAKCKLYEALTGHYQFPFVV